MHSPDHSSPQRKGFTLIEILAATAIMSVAMLMVLSIVAFVMNGWNRGTDAIEASGRAQFTLDIIEKELSTLSTRKSTENYEFLKIKETSSTDINFPMGNNFTPKSYELYFLGIPSDSATDAVQCIAYQVRFENPLTGSGTKNRIMGLFRAKSTPRATILNGYKLVTKDQAPASNDGLVDFMDSSDRYVNTDSSDEQHASNLKNASNLLLSDVYSLQFIPYYWDNNNNITYSGTLGNPEPLNNGQIFAITAQNAASLDGDMNRRLAYMDVILTLLTKNGASFVRQKGNYSAIQDPPSQQAEAWIRQNTQTFSRRISFQGELFQSTDNP